MSEFLDLAERVQLGIRIGESHYREFKSAWEGPPDKKIPRAPKDLSADVARTMVGFANADGGELLVGVEDDGTVTGVPLDPTERRVVLEATRTHVHAMTPLPSPRTTVIELDGKAILYFHVPKGTTVIHLTADGRCLKRIDRDTVPYPAEHINAQRLEDSSRGWDRESADGATLNDLDLDLVKSVAAQIAYGISVEKCLQHLDLAEFTAEGLRLRRAALVLFAKDIRRWHSGCFMRVMTVRGKEKHVGADFNVGKSPLVSENILRLVDRAWEALTTELAQHTRFTEAARFQRDLLYPQVACREALINAIVHRNYAIEGRGIEVSIFDDRMEVFSPGQLLSTISLADIRALRGAHESRNPLIARVLRETGLVQEMGEGMRRIFSIMKSNALTEPELSSNTSGFTVTLHNKSLYPPAVKLWLSNFDRLALDENERAVVALGYGGQEFSTQDIIDRLGIVDTDEVRELVTSIKKHGILETTRDRAAVERHRKRQSIPRRSVPKYRIRDISQSSPRSPAMPGGSGIEGGTEAEDEEREPFEVFLWNLDWNVGVTDVTTELSRFGVVLAVDLPPGDGGRPNRGYAVASIEGGSLSLDEFIVRVDGLQIGRRPVHATRSRRTRRRH